METPARGFEDRSKKWNRRMNLVRVETDDGLLLDGVRLPAEDRRRSPTAPSFVLVHGTGSNFYHSGILEFVANRLAEQGREVWRVNTRGHDGIATIPGRNGGVPGGATYERVTDARHDLAAWVRLAASAGGERVVLVGHSMGAVKSLLYATQEDVPRVVGVVGLSPPRFCHSLWMQHPRADAFRDAWRKACCLVRAGDGDAYLPVTQPVPFLATAAGFVAKYGPHDELDFVPRLNSIRCPALITIGTQSAAASPAFDGLAETILALPDRPNDRTVKTIEGANTGYSGSESLVWDELSAWLGKTIP